MEVFITHRLAGPSTKGHHESYLNPAGKSARLLFLSRSTVVGYFAFGASVRGKCQGSGFPASCIDYRLNVKGLMTYAQTKSVMLFAFAAAVLLLPQLLFVVV